MSAIARVPQPPALGIPVIYDPEFARVAEACGVWPLKHIVVGDKFYRLPMDERTAILYHEAGHCLHWHMEKRLLVVPLLLLGTRRVREWVHGLARRQEYEADALAWQHGYGPAMARVIRRFTEQDSIFYPSHAERLARLEAVK